MGLRLRFLQSRDSIPTPFPEPNPRPGFPFLAPSVPVLVLHLHPTPPVPYSRACVSDPLGPSVPRPESQTRLPHPHHTPVLQAAPQASTKRPHQTRGGGRVCHPLSQWLHSLPQPHQCGHAGGGARRLASSAQGPVLGDPDNWAEHCFVSAAAIIGNGTRAAEAASWPHSERLCCHLS